MPAPAPSLLDYPEVAAHVQKALMSRDQLWRSEVATRDKWWAKQVSDARYTFNLLCSHFQARDICLCVRDGVGELSCWSFKFIVRIVRIWNCIVDHK